MFDLGQKVLQAFGVFGGVYLIRFTFLRKNGLFIETWITGQTEEN